MHLPGHSSAGMMIEFQFTFVSGVPCTPDRWWWDVGVEFQFTFVSGVPCTTTSLRHVRDSRVSIHLREWGALHRLAMPCGVWWVCFNSPS